MDVICATGGILRSAYPWMGVVVLLRLGWGENLPRRGWGIALGANIDVARGGGTTVATAIVSVFAFVSGGGQRGAGLGLSFTTSSDFEPPVAGNVHVVLHSSRRPRGRAPARFESL